MRDDYKMKGQTKKIQLELESDVVDRLVSMEGFTKLTQSELANTALKRFIAQHKDFLPEEQKKLGRA